MAVKTKEEEMMDIMAEEIRKEIDEGIMASMLIETGWTPVHFTFRDSAHAADVSYWLWENFWEKDKPNTWARYGNDYLFKDKKDAEWFILRWL